MHFRSYVFAGALVLVLQSAASATTCNSVAACVLGVNVGTGVGLEGVSQQNVGLYGVSTANHGIDGRSRENDGVFGYTAAQSSTVYNARAGVYGQDAGSGLNSGVYGVSASSTGVSGNGVNGVAGSGSDYGVVGYGAYAGGYFAGYGGTTGLDVVGGTFAPAIEMDSPGGEIAFGQNLSTPNAPALVYELDASGDEYLAGHLTTSGGTYARTRSLTGPDVASYDARSASPTLEDFGRGTIRQGSGHVALDPTFASTIDTRSYFVFITPHGNSRSLFTTGLNGSGFDVHESEDGRSNVSFDYRVVGRPLDTSARHLPAVSTLPQFIAAARPRRAAVRPHVLERIAPTR